LTPEEDALARVVGWLEALEIPYMVAGSMASSHHGRPRMTHDVDVVIDPTETSLVQLVDRLLAGGFYVDSATAQDALRRRRQFNAIEPRSATKLDLIIRKDRPFSVEELRRRESAEVADGLRVALATPEDTVLSKLEWAKKSGASEKQLTDVAGVVEVNGNRLDREYVERWARELDVLDLWRRVAG
jgi:hypothetical protein